MAMVTRLSNTFQLLRLLNNGCRVIWLGITLLAALSWFLGLSDSLLFLFR